MKAVQEKFNIRKGQESLFDSVFDSATDRIDLDSVNFAENSSLMTKVKISRKFEK
jgi:hypothetical protein